MKHLASLLLAAAVLFVWAAPVVAHQVTFKGTVISAEAEAVSVRVVDAETKKVSTMTFRLDSATKVLRGDALTTFEKARVQKDETIAVTIDHDMDEELAIVVRLDEKR